MDRHKLRKVCAPSHGPTYSLSHTPTVNGSAPSTPLVNSQYAQAVMGGAPPQTGGPNPRQLPVGHHNAPVVKETKDVKRNRALMP
eukprot:gene33528-41376_t